MPDHPSWPAELVEKATAAVRRTWHMNEHASADETAAAVLSALSGDLVPREEHEDENDRLRDALRRIDSLAARWSAPLRHEPGDWGDAAWGVVGTEASLIAHKALGGTVESARARLPERPTQERGSVRAERDEARSQADALAEALAQVATIAPGGTRWPRFTLPAHHRIYALVRFQDETVFAGGEDVEAARIALRDELLRLASYRSSSSTETGR